MIDDMTFAQSVVHFCIPHHTNNHKAKALHASSLLIISITIICYQLFLSLLPHASRIPILGYAANISIEEVVNLTNQKRQEAGLSALNINPLLSSAAKAKAEHMLANDYWAHVAPDGTEPWKFFTDSGYKYRYAGENLARDFSNATSAIDAWMASPSHKENMLSSKYKEIGIAVVEGDLAGVDTTLIVQLFGTTLVDTTPSVPIAQAKQNIAVPTTIPVVTVVPTSAYTPTPTVSETVFLAEVTPIPSPQARLANDIQASSGKSQVLISPFNTTRTLSMVTIISIIGITLIDWTVATHRRVQRIGGRTFAHVGFLGMILALVLLAKAGQII